MNTKNSRLSGFYKKTLEERIAIVQEWSNLDDTAKDVLEGSMGLSLEQASHMIENAIGRYSLPFGIGTNFLINQKDYLIPMVIEEPSVVAAVSNAAKMFRAGGGFISHSDKPIMIGQIQLLDIKNTQTAEIKILENKELLLNEANRVGGSIVRRGGGARDIEVRIFEDTQIGNMIVVHLLFDTQEAMGANAINTAAEHLAPFLEEITASSFFL